MAHLKKISATLSIASALLLEACGTGGDSGPEPVANTKAPLLIGSWTSGCVLTASGTATNTGSSGGGGSVSGGEAFRSSVVYNQNGRVQFTTENFSSSDCNPNTFVAPLGQYEGVYFIGEASLANDSSAVTTIDYSNSSSTTYSIFDIVNSTALSLGSGEKSTPGSDGSSSTTRLDGLGSPYLKQ